MRSSGGLRWRPGGCSGRDSATLPSVPRRGTCSRPPSLCSTTAPDRRRMLADRSVAVSHYSLVIIAPFVDKFIALASRKKWLPPCAPVQVTACQSWRQADYPQLLYSAWRVPCPEKCQHGGVLSSGNGARLCQAGNAQPTCVVWLEGESVRPYDGALPASQ